MCVYVSVYVWGVCGIFLSGVGRQRIIEVYAVSISLCWKTTPLMNMVLQVMLLNLFLFICFGGGGWGVGGEEGR